MPATSSGRSSYAPSSRSKTGKILSDAEYRQRKAASEASARRRRRAIADARGSGGTRRASKTDATSGLGNSKAAGYVDQNRARSAFESNGVSGADIRQTREERSGFLVFAGKNQASHDAFVKSLNQLGFMTSIGADGSGIAINRAGQAIKIGAAGNAAGPAPKRRRLERTIGSIR